MCGSCIGTAVPVNVFFLHLCCSYEHKCCQSFFVVVLRLIYVSVLYGTLFSIPVLEFEITFCVVLPVYDLVTLLHPSGKTYQIS